MKEKLPFNEKSYIWENEPKQTVSTAVRILFMFCFYALSLRVFGLFIYKEHIKNKSSCWKCCFLSRFLMKTRLLQAAKMTGEYYFVPNV